MTVKNLLQRSCCETVIFGLSSLLLELVVAARLMFKLDVCCISCASLWLYVGLLVEHPDHK